MILNWKHERVLSVESRFRRGGYLKFLPGINEVPADEWAAVKMHLKPHIDTGSIVEVSNGTITRLEPIEAQKLVQKCVNPATLRRWLQKETRDSVRSAIQNKISDIFDKRPIPSQEKGSDFDDYLGKPPVDAEPETESPKSKSSKQKVPSTTKNSEDTEAADEEAVDESNEDTESSEKTSKSGRKRK